MEKRIADLSDMEAVYSLHILASKLDSGLDLADEAGVRQFVETAGRVALGSERAREFMNLFETPEAAADLSRACLAAIESAPGILGEAGGEFEKVMARPPKTQQMDMGISLGLLTLAGMAMLLSGSLKVTTNDLVVEYKGNDKVVEIFKAVLAMVPGWPG